MPDEIFEFRQRVIASIWPNEFEEIKRATITFSILLHRAAQLFLERSEAHGDRLYTFKFYKAHDFNKYYDEDVKRYTEWIEQCHQLTRESTKAANWFADIVRQDINPMFFAEKGKFLVMEGPFMDMLFRTALLEFNAEEMNCQIHKSS